MGLAGRKQKQRIPADPRNLSWADDASRFGLSYLSKFGWDASQGLGSSGDGVKTHVKVQQKLDMMGIGAQHQRDPNGIAWKQNKEFEALLKRLNETAEQAVDGRDTREGSGGEPEATDKTSTSTLEETVEKRSMQEPTITTTKKRKHRATDDPDASENTRKKSRKKEKKSRSGSDIPDNSIGSISDPSSPSSPVPGSELIPKPRPMAHRARIRAAKQISGKSALAISEILGIAPSSLSSTPTSPLTPLSSSPTPAPQPSFLSLDNLTTSTKSVADYFKEKLVSRAPSSSTPSGSATPGLGASRLALGGSHIFHDDADEPPRRGIGSQGSVTCPPLQVPEPVPPSASESNDVDSEKLRRKAERKAERQKRREARDTQSIPESVSTSAKNDTGTVQEKPKEKKRKERK